MLARNKMIIINDQIFTFYPLKLGGGVGGKTCGLQGGGKPPSYNFYNFWTIGGNKGSFLQIDLKPLRGSRTALGYPCSTYPV